MGLVDLFSLCGLNSILSIIGGAVVYLSTLYAISPRQKHPQIVYISHKKKKKNAHNRFYIMLLDGYLNQN